MVLEEMWIRYNFSMPIKLVEEKNGIKGWKKLKVFFGTIMINQTARDVGR